MAQGSDWESRYAACERLFGLEPSPLLKDNGHLLRRGARALAVGDGEGRNGLWLASQGLRVCALDLSPTALGRAADRARREGLALETQCCDALSWQWPRRAYEVITLIFVHLPAAQRRRLHQYMRTALRPGGLIFIEAYHRDHLRCGSGGPADPELLYTPQTLREDFAALDILTLRKTDTQVVMGDGTQGPGVVLHFIARA